MGVAPKIGRVTIFGGELTGIMQAVVTINKYNTCRNSLA